MNPNKLQIFTQNANEKRIALFVLAKLCDLVVPQELVDAGDTSYPYVNVNNSGVTGSCSSKDCFDRKVIDFSELGNYLMEEKPRKVKLNDEYTAEVTRNEVTVGCQKFPISVIKDIVKAAESL